MLAGALASTTGRGAASSMATEAATEATIVQKQLNLTRPLECCDGIAEASCRPPPIGWREQPLGATQAIITCSGDRARKRRLFVLANAELEDRRLGLVFDGLVGHQLGLVPQARRAQHPQPHSAGCRPCLRSRGSGGRSSYPRPGPGG